MKYTRHNLTTGYPYDKIYSLEKLPENERVKISIDEENNLSLDIRNHAEPNKERKDQFSFAMSRAYELQEALRIAEEQIKAILEENEPFIPEYFGFEPIKIPKDIYDVPITIYGSKYDERFIMHQNLIENFDGEENNQWVIGKKEADGKYTTILFDISLQRVGAVVLQSLGCAIDAPLE